MKIKKIKNALLIAILFTSMIGCSSDNANDTEADIIDTTEDIITELPAAFADFDADEIEVYISDNGTTITIETTGLPNHTTPYWSTSHPLYVAPTVTNAAEMTPTRIDTSGRDNSSTLTVSSNPSKASSTTNTSLNAIGIAVSGAYIYNDYEGPVPLSSATGSLDYSGAHIGPTQYHYHLEPLAFTNDDDKLVGIMSDGFFIYGRKCNSTGTYPTGLDASGGHTSTTQHTETDEYHYHIINELYSNTGRYIVFAGPYQGTPNAFN
tara:strand:+ start:39306 stop:40100 length:795 start_codon:yes stop_codon:yes gene_type:complete